MEQYHHYSENRYRNHRGGSRSVILYIFIFLLIVVLITASIGLVSLLAPLNQQEDSVNDGNALLAATGGGVEETSSNSQNEASTTLGATGQTETQEDLTPEEAAQKVIPSVVCIQNLSGDVQGYTEGSGIILTEDGYIATNAHVVEGAQVLKVMFSDGEMAEATLVGSDSLTDLALIKVDRTGLTPAELGDSDDLNVAETVLAIGNPGGMEFNSSVTSGIVSAKDRPLELSEGYTMNTIQTDAAINPGNSGGALINLKGQVVGINSAKYVATGYEGLGFAITINQALPILEDLKEYGYVKNRGITGIDYVFIDEWTARFYQLPVGCYVSSIQNPNIDDIQEGDVIVSINGQEITSEQTFKSAIAGKKPGDKVEVECYSSSTGRSYTTTITLMEASSNGTLY